MNDQEPNIKIPIDLTNPGQFFARCGLMELADRLWRAGCLDNICALRQPQAIPPCEAELAVIIDGVERRRRLRLEHGISEHSREFTFLPVAHAKGRVVAIQFAHPASFQWGRARSGAESSVRRHWATQGANFNGAAPCRSRTSAGQVWEP